MIKAKLPKTHDGNYPDNSVIFDWKENPESVMETIDSILQDYGLEVINYETFNDSLCYEIIKRKKADNRKQIIKFFMTTIKGVREEYENGASCRDLHRDIITLKELLEKLR